MTWAVLPFDKYILGIGELVAEANRDGSERVIAVVAGALLEEAVNRTIRERLIDDAKTTKTANRLLKPESALGNVTTQIDLLYLLGAFDEATCKALKGLAGIRNYFAHRTDASFNSDDEDFVQSMNRLEHFHV